MTAAQWKEEEQLLSKTVGLNPILPMDSFPLIFCGRPLHRYSKKCKFAVFTISGKRDCCNNKKRWKAMLYFQ